MSKTFTIKVTVWEYYEVEANSRKEALSIGLEDPWFVDYRNKRIVEYPLSKRRGRK